MLRIDIKCLLLLSSCSPGVTQGLPSSSLTVINLAGKWPILPTQRCLIFFQTSLPLMHSLSYVILAGENLTGFLNQLMFWNHTWYQRMMLTENGCVVLKEKSY